MMNIFDMISESISCEETEIAKRNLIGDIRNFLNEIEKELEDGN